MKYEYKFETFLIIKEMIIGKNFISNGQETKYLKQMKRKSILHIWNPRVPCANSIKNNSFIIKCC